MISNGWLKRAERLLQNEPETFEHGLLFRRQAANALRENDFDRAIETNRKCAEIAERFDDADLRTVALHDHGQILVARGDVEGGMSLIDEAMTAAVSGEVNPSTLGALYCRTLALCRALADFNRARQWSEAAWRWTQSNTAPGYTGVCRVHNAETMRHQGKWTEAEQTVRQACEDFARGHLQNHAGHAYYELGELALRKGDFDDAEDAFRRTLEYGVDPVPGLSLLRQAQNKPQAAVQSIERALGESTGDRLRRARLLAAGIHIYLANNQLPRAEAAVEELTKVSSDFGCPCFVAHALMGRGAVELESGDTTAATTSLREAWAAFKKANFPYDAARAQTLMAQAYMKAGNTGDARLHLDTAMKTFRDLGARPDVEVTRDLIDQSDNPQSP